MLNLRLPTCSILLLILTACAFTSMDESMPIATMTSVRVLQMTPVPTIQREIQWVATAAPTATDAPSAIQCPAEDQSTHYRIVADMDYAQHVLTVEQQVDYVNRSQESFDQLLLTVRPNSLPDVFSLVSVEMGTTNLRYELTRQKLIVDLPQAIGSGCAIQFTLGFQLKIPEMDRDGVNAYKGYLGYSNRQTNLGHWTPVMALRQSDDWLFHEEIPIGEQDVLDAADWDVTLHIKDAPETLKVAAPGRVEESESNQWRYTLPSARDFSLSMSADYQVSTSETESGTTVELYTFADALIQTDAGAINSPAFALEVATQSLSMYSDLFGPLPYQRLVVVQGDFPDGMEFSGLVFVGGEYFRGFGGPTSYLMIITVHEVAHQWWYGQVGNDQAIDPWLDEALATYSEYAFIEEYFPALKDWWWSFRVDNFSPEGFVDSTVYEFKTRREYINAIYLRGVRMLQELRANLGTDAFFDWLRRYAEAGSQRVVTPEFFWSLLSPEQFKMTAYIREKYFKQQIVMIVPGS